MYYSPKSNVISLPLNIWFKSVWLLNEFKLNVNPSLQYKSFNTYYDSYLLLSYLLIVPGPLPSPATPAALSHRRGSFMTCQCSLLIGHLRGFLGRFCLSWAQRQSESFIRTSYSGIFFSLITSKMHKDQYTHLQQNYLNLWPFYLFCINVNYQCNYNNYTYYKAVQFSVIIFDRQ